MSNVPALLSSEKRVWSMLIVPEHYDRSPLTARERDALVSVANSADKIQSELTRFQKPLCDVVTLRAQSKEVYRTVRRLIFKEMLQRGRTFWEWSKEEWMDIICPTSQDYLKKYGASHPGRPSLVNMAYLLGGISDLYEIHQHRDATETARSIFGANVIEQELKRITTVLVGAEGRGYSESKASKAPFRQALCLLFLLSRSPYLEDLSLEILETAIQRRYSILHSRLTRIAQTLQELGIIECPLEAARPPVEDRMDMTGVPAGWGQWCIAWYRRNTSTSPTRRRLLFSNLLIVGRWLAEQHPAIVSPEQWDEDLALTYVSYICAATAGEYVTAMAWQRLRKKGLAGKPLTPRSVDHKLSVMRCFFADLQDYPHTVAGMMARKIEKRFNPIKTFATPQHIRRLIQPDPRDIDEMIWCKLTYAAATLTDEDFAGPGTHYPLNYYRAAALLWVTSARRPNEITRLRLGCIRRDWDPQMLDEAGVPLSEEAQLCYLHLPSTKTKGPYWVPIPKYTADAIESWERERPTNQQNQIDRKDQASVQFLFCFRNRKMGIEFINNSLIPILCKRAGVPENDARGAITGHRARSTIATMLRKNGISLEDISEFLGHASPEMVRAYARTDQFRFGRDLNRANDLMRIVEGIIDTRAAKAGKPNVFFFLGRGSDGQPRFCGNPTWEKCAHRLACLKCSMYVGASQAARLTERLEARDELFKFQTQVEMIPQERAAVEGDIETLTSLIEAETNVPPPELPNDQFRFNGPQIPEIQILPPNRETQEDLVSLGRELVALHRELAAAEKKSDGRNAHVRSLKKQIGALTERMAELDQISVLTKASLES